MTNLIAILSITKSKSLKYLNFLALTGAFRGTSRSRPLNRRFLQGQISSLEVFQDFIVVLLLQGRFISEMEKWNERHLRDYFGTLMTLLQS